MPVRPSEPLQSQWKGGGVHVRPTSCAVGPLLSLVWAPTDSLLDVPALATNRSIHVSYELFSTVFVFADEDLNMRLPHDRGHALIDRAALLLP